jgi:hypothetical protein
MQLLAGRTGQEYNQRKKRKGAFWQDRYHATAVQRNGHLIRCMTYIDLNMVRAGVVKHPQKWIHSGYNEIQNPKQRYGLIDFKSMIRFLPVASQAQLKEAHRDWIEDELQKTQLIRESKWTQSIAVGDKLFVKQIKKQLGIGYKGRKVIEEQDDYQLRDGQAHYADGTQNLHYWNIDNER